MLQQRCFAVFTGLAIASWLAVVCPAATPAAKPERTLAVAVATYREKVRIKVKRWPVNRMIFAADFRGRVYSGVTMAYAAPLVGPEPWEVLIRSS